MSVILPAELWAEIFLNLFERLNEDWQFESLQNLSLVCKAWNNLLNYKLALTSKPNIWKIIFDKYSITLSDEPNTEVLDVRKVLVKQMVPQQVSQISPMISIQGFNGSNYVSRGQVNLFSLFNIKCVGIGFLKRMVKHDEDSKILLENSMQQIIDDVSINFGEDYHYKHKGITINEDVPLQKYEFFSECERESHRPYIHGDREFEDVKKEHDIELFDFLKNQIGGEDEDCGVVISNIEVLRAYIKKHCPIVVHFKDIYIDIIGSVAQVFITKEGKCIYFEFTASD